METHVTRHTGDISWTPTMACDFSTLPSCQRLHCRRYFFIAASDLLFSQGLLSCLVSSELLLTVRGPLSRCARARPRLHVGCSGQNRACRRLQPPGPLNSHWKNKARKQGVQTMPNAPNIWAAASSLPAKVSLTALSGRSLAWPRHRTGPSWLSCVTGPPGLRITHLRMQL